MLASLSESSEKYKEIVEKRVFLCLSMSLVLLLGTGARSSYLLTLGVSLFFCFCAWWLWVDNLRYTLWSTPLVAFSTASC